MLNIECFIKTQTPCHSILLGDCGLVHSAAAAKTLYVFFLNPMLIHLARFLFFGVFVLLLSTTCLSSIFWVLSYILEIKNYLILIVFSFVYYSGICDGYKRSADSRLRTAGAKVLHTTRTYRSNTRRWFTHFEHMHESVEIDTIWGPNSDAWEVTLRNWELRWFWA